MDSDSEDSENRNTDIPERKNPKIVKRQTHNLFGFLQVEATTHHDSIRELEGICDKILDEIPDTGIKDSIDNSIQDTLREIMRLEPDEISDASDLPSTIQNSPLVTIDAIQSSTSLSEIIVRIQEQIDGDQYGIDKYTSEILIPDEKSREHLSYFAMASAIIEQRSASLIKELLIAEEFQESEEIDEFIEEYLSQNQREDLLYNCGMIDGPLLAEMQHVRGNRNRLVHRPHERKYINPDEFAEITETAFQVAKELDEDLMAVLQEKYG